MRARGGEADLENVMRSAARVENGSPSAGTMRVDQVCEELGLIVRPLVNMCVFSPPLVITKDEIDAMFDILDTAIGRVALDFGRTEP